jgi:TrmH family RNA methyltransferase
MEIIKSVKNEFVRQVTELASCVERKAADAVPLYGINAVEWAHNAGWNIEYILISESAIKSLYNNEFLSQFKKYYISDHLNKKITGVSHIIDVCGFAGKNISNNALNIFGSKKPVIILDRVLDHGNIGTIVRTMRAFGFNNLIMTNYSMDIYYRNIVGASRGEVFNIDFANIDVDELMLNIEKNNYKIISTKAYFDYDINDAENKFIMPESYAIVFGNEEHGVSEQILNCADFSIGCHMQNNVDSLNVGVAAGIILNKLQLSDKNI